MHESIVIRMTTVAGGGGRIPSNSRLEPSPPARGTYSTGKMRDRGVVGTDAATSPPFLTLGILPTSSLSLALPFFSTTAAAAAAALSALSVAPASEDPGSIKTKRNETKPNTTQRNATQGTNNQA